MREIPSLLRRFKMLVVAVIILIALYIWLALTTTPDPATLQRYNLSIQHLRGLTLAIALPYIIIWIIGMLGYMWLRKYTDALGDSQDGKAFRTVTNGILLVVLWLPVSAVCASAASHYYGVHPSAVAAATRFVNYVNVFLLLPAFYLVYAGSRQLVGVAKVHAHGLTQRQSLGYVVFTALYMFVALSDTSRRVAARAGGHATYYLPDWAIVLTILLPRLIIWFIGLAAVSNIFLYRQKVKGAIYKEALRFMAVGLGVVVCGITALRIVQSLSSVLSEWSLGALLLLIYLLLGVLGFGYFMLAKGAKRLLKIEEL